MSSPGIRQLQLMLLKVSLILGVEVHVNVEFINLVEPPAEQTDDGESRTRCCVIAVPQVAPTLLHVSAIYGEPRLTACHQTEFRANCLTSFITSLF